MTAQVTALNSKGVSAAYISSETDDHAQCEAILTQGKKTRRITLESLRD